MRRLFFINPKLPFMIMFQGIFWLLGQLIILVFLPDKLRISIGFLAGVLYGVFSLICMSITIHQMMYMRDDKAAIAKSLGGFALRIAVLVLVMIVCYWLGSEAAMLAAIIGAFSMKVSAYLEPFTDKLLKNSKKGR